MRFDLGTLDLGERSLPFGLLVSWCSTVHRCLSATVRCPRPLCSDLLSVDCCPTLCRSQKKKKKKLANDRRKKHNLAPSTKKHQPTRKQPKLDTTSTDGPSTVTSYVLFWPRRRPPLVGLGNVTALQEQKLSTEVRSNYSACRCMTISYP